MDPYPHRYHVAAAAAPESLVELTSPGLEPLRSAPPKEFGGPGDRWSPETLLVAAMADCFILTFRAVARAAKLPWTALECRVEGTLERPGRDSLFTGFTLVATLTVPAGTDVARARTLLEKAEHGCLISNSLSGAKRLVAEVVTA
jgi:organic hydroperoxide reductase OsmC/OhrA